MTKLLYSFHNTANRTPLMMKSFLDQRDIFEIIKKVTKRKLPEIEGDYFHFKIPLPDMDLMIRGITNPYPRMRNKNGKEEKEEKSMFLEVTPLGEDMALFRKYFASIKKALE